MNIIMFRQFKHAIKVLNFYFCDSCSINSVLWVSFMCPGLCKLDKFLVIFTPQPLGAVGVLFSPMVSGWAGGRQEKFVRPVSQEL